ncbi:tetratricopeptide repeat protein [Actinomadura luteofluorescens]|uniref:tetratricopeptide repeat protein n=1 Tax=Actinomadura luteofluorescens TaxID=46163 RepID=UPI003469DFD7
MTAGDTDNQITDSVVIGSAVLGRDITMVLPAQVPLAMSGLPPASPAFTGRQHDLDTLLAVLAPPGQGDEGRQRAAVVVTAVGGLAGVGKTELAVQAARTALHRGWFPGGVLFADLFGYDNDRRRDPGEVLEGMLTALGVPGEHIPAHAQDRSRMFTSILTEFAARDRRVLVVADNVNTSHQARLLLPTDGVTAAVVTSRHTLGMLNARLLDLNVLDLDGAVAMLDQTVRIARPDDTRIPADPPGAARLAEICGRLPLALRIAAAHLAEDPDLTPTALARDLDQVQPLDALTYRDGVRRAFELSYRTLTPQQQQLFRLLTINPGPDISTTTAAALADQNQAAVQVVLKELARAHLIERGTAPGRWRMHDLVRQYATTLQQTHANDDSDQALARLLAHYLATTRAANAHLDPQVSDPAAGGFTDRWEALAWLDAEYPNLLAATRLAAAHHTHLRIARDLPPAMWDFLLWQGHFTDWIDLSRTALLAAHDLDDRSGQGAALNSLGVALRRVRRFEEAITAHTDAAAIHRELGDRHGEGMALNSLGLALQQVQRFEEAITAHTDAATIHRELGDRHSEGNALNNLGLVLRKVRRFEEAITAHTDAATIHRELGDQHGEGVAVIVIKLAWEVFRMHRS